MTTPPLKGMVPPLRFVPPPRGTKGTPYLLQARTTPATSSVECTKTTASGRRSSRYASYW